MFKNGSMKPQQQNTDIKGKSHVYVQTPDGEEINVPSRDPRELAGKKDEAQSQTADQTPTTHSKEVPAGKMPRKQKNREQKTIE